MLARIFRFHGHNAVRRAYKNGRPVRGSIGSLHVDLSSKLDQPKVAVVVSKKVSKSAVVRNRIRRRVFEIVRLNKANITRPAGLVFTIYEAEVATMPSEQLSHEVRELLKRAKLL